MPTLTIFVEHGVMAHIPMKTLELYRNHSQTAELLSAVSSTDKKSKASNAELLTEITKLREEIDGKVQYILHFGELLLPEIHEFA